MRVKYSIQGTKIFEKIPHLKMLAPAYVAKFCFTLRFHFTFSKAFCLQQFYIYHLFSQLFPDFPLCIRLKQQRRMKLVTRHSDVPFFQGIVQATVPLPKFRNSSFFVPFPTAGTVPFRSVPFTHTLYAKPASSLPLYIHD